MYEIFENFHGRDMRLKFKFKGGHLLKKTKAALVLYWKQWFWTSKKLNSPFSISLINDPRILYNIFPNSIGHWA